MSTHKTKIFVVDDDPVGLMVATCKLEEATQYDIHEFESGPALLAAMSEAPDIVLLDIEMPGMSGIDACRALRAGGDDHAIVLFVSGNDDLETRLAAYAAGGSDYIVKPYIPEDLLQKVRIAEKDLARREALAQQAQVASQTAFTAMSSMGEMGALLDFLRNSFICGDMAQLADALFEALRQYGLNGLLEIGTPQGAQCMSSHGECTPLERSILEHARGMGRIFQLRDRLAINYPHVTLLIPDLPIADPDRVGRLRDHVAILVEGAEARVVAVLTEMQRREQALGITLAAKALTQALADIERMQAGNRAAAMEINSDYLRQLTNAFVHLGLSEDQESALACMAQQTSTRLEALMDEGQLVGNRLHEVSASLGCLADT